ncbi:hypothetical protein JKF63_02382 [Porcisia hertigi]|uniref:Protein kinase domain-containing protein n=1 Tax=Porcisia hertigi TaxID=2761500 RepID=A0A836L2Q9_9TRYP|nr:hypothetical protein JKF63_02382 [Porcisia hertigi]
MVSRSKGSDPTSSRDLARKTGHVIRPGRADGAASAATLPWTEQAPPPFRLSPRAQRAAESRSASRATTPTGGIRTPANGLREIPPQIPLTRVDSRGISPRTPRGTRNAEATPQSARSHHTDASNAYPLSSLELSPPAVRPLDRGAAHRCVVDGAETPVELKSVANATAVTPNYRTEDTISFHVDDELSWTPQRTADRIGSHLRRRPQIPSPSSLDDGPTPLTVDDSGQLVPMHRAKVRQTTTADGRKVWLLYNPCRGDAVARCAQEIPAPPPRLSRRAQDILAAKRRALEDDAMKRHLQAVKRQVGPEKKLTLSRRRRNQLAFYPSDFYSDDVARRHSEEAARMQDDRWAVYLYDGMESCTETRRASGTATSRWETEKVVRTLQPVQVPPAGGTTGTCGCAVYEALHHDDALRRLIDGDLIREEGIRRYLNLQPMQLASVDMQQMVDLPLESLRHGLSSPSEMETATEDTRKSAAAQRSLATFGGLWCTAEAVREDGHLATRKNASALRRIVRICGGQAQSVPLHAGSHETLDVRCYELLLFPCESLSPSVVNYGSEGLTLGQVIAPPASSFPLTPRIISDPMTLKEYKKRLLATRSRQVAIANAEEDRATFSAAPGASDARQYLTLTMATISPRQKNSIDLTLIMLPFRSAGIFDGKTVAEVPRFCSATVMSHRRLQGLSLSFTTTSAFMSAYKALLWATECDIVDVTPLDGEGGAVPGTAYSKLRLCATTSPMVPWASSFGKNMPGQPREETFQGNCLDFAVLALAAQPGAVQATGVGERDPLMLEDFVIADTDDNTNETDDGAQSVQSSTPANQQRRSSIFTSTLASPKTTDSEWGSTHTSTDNVVGFTAFGVIRRAVSQKTSEVFDVRVMPRNRGRIVPTISDDASTTEEGRVALPAQTARALEDHLLQQDAEASIMLEYVSRLPFQSRVYGVLVDDQRYYIFQEPWVSALSLEQSMAGSVEHDALMSNETLSKMTRTTAVMSLKDFIHAVLHPGVCEREAREEVQFEIARVLAAQLLLLVTSLHGKGMLLGPCPPQRLLVRIVDPTRDNQQAEKASDEDTPERKATSSLRVASSDIQLFVPDIGINTVAWGYERQQCGVLEYLPPMYVLEQMLPDSFDKNKRPWTTRDDWWTFLTLCFELFSMDGSALVTPEMTADIPTPTPTITKFFSPVEIFDVWQRVITDSALSVSSTAAEAIGMRTRRYVHQRVLTSVSGSIDAWVTTKAEEIQYFGTTAPRRGPRVVRAVPPLPGTQGRSMGISLSAMYLKSAREVSDTSSIAFRTDDEKPEDRAMENILADMPWLFQVRDFFDTILDAVFSSTSCSVHGPALLLVSHPFFQSLQLAKVFDGSYIYSAAVADYAARHLRKSNVQAALLEYRTRAYRGPLRGRPDVPLVIANSAYTSGRASTGAPLLLLSSAAFPNDHTARENSETTPSQDLKADGAGGLVLSCTNSMAPSAIPSPRAQSPIAGTWDQQRLKALYDPGEWQSIAALEAEVRGALHSHGPRDSASSRQGFSATSHAFNLVPISSQPVQSGPCDSGLAQVSTSFVTSTDSRHLSRDYDHTLGSNTAPLTSAHPPGSAGGSCSGDIHGPATTSTSRLLFEKTATAPFVQPSQPRRFYNSRPVTRRDSHHGSATEEGVGSPERVREKAAPARRKQRCAESSELERGFKAMPVNSRHHRRTPAATGSLHHSNDGGAVGHTLRPVHSSKHSSLRSSKHSNVPQQEEHSSRRSWPREFLETATVQKKGLPRRLSDPQKSDLDPMTIDQQTQRSMQSIRSHAHRVSSVENTTPRRYSFQDSSSEGSYMLVPSDGEMNTVRAPMSAYQSSGASYQSPAPRYPHASHTEIASNRNSYFEF